ncbi:MAG: CPBP family intramembrane metalloprotease, partial [bacterium]|nr:CPBP family intramembrane metalloprotease [bacterium]
LHFYWYDTTSSWSGFLFETILYGLLQPLAAGLAIFVVTAAAETIYRERHPERLSIARMFTPRALGTKSAFKSILLGVTLTVFFLTYQIIFYLIAGRFGAWSPSDVPYDNLLNTAMPWLAVLAVGFFPAVSEEFISRAFSISFLQKILRNRFTWLAVLLPAVIWGFGHAGYPNQPFWIRGAEVGLAGIVIGVLMLRQGILALLVWHYTVDALYTALLLFRSDNIYFVTTAAIATGLLAIPLIISIAAYLRRGAFVPEAGCRNADLPAPSVPVAVEIPPSVPAPAASVPAHVPLSLTGRTVAGAFIALGILAALIPIEKVGDFLTYTVPRDTAVRTFADSLRRTGWCDPDTMKLAAFIAEDEDIGPDSYNAYLLKQLNSVPKFNRIADERLGTGRWLIMAFVPENRERFAGTVHARTGRIESLHLLRPEEAPGDSLSEERAQAMVESTLTARGENMSLLELKEHHEQARPARLDHTLIYEAKDGDPRHIGEARYRRSGMLSGGCLRASARPFYKIPEQWERDRRATTALRAVLKGLRILLIAGFAVWGALLLALKTRRGEIAWGRSFRWAILPAVLAAAGALNNLYLEQQSYFSRIEQPWSVFRMESLTQVLVSVMVLYVLAALAFALISGLYPSALTELRAPLRRQARWDAALACGATLGAILLIQAIRAALHAAAPAWIPFGGWSVADWIATPWPILSMMFSIVARGILTLALLSFAAYLWIGPMRAPLMRTVLAVAGVLALVPDSAVEPGEWLLAAANNVLTLLVLWLVLRFVIARRTLSFVVACATAAIFHIVSQGISSGNFTAEAQSCLLAVVAVILFAIWFYWPLRRGASAESEVSNP